MAYLNKEEKENKEEKYRRIREPQDFFNDDCEEENEDWEDEIYDD